MRTAARSLQVLCGIYKRGLFPPSLSGVNPDIHSHRALLARIFDSGLFPHSRAPRVTRADFRQWAPSIDSGRFPLTIHHKFRNNLAELQQKACRDGGWEVDVTRHGAWDAGMALLAHGATRAGTAATHGHEHDGCRRSSRAGLLMNGNLPDALDGARWRFERARCGWQRSRGRAAEQQVCCAARRFLRIIVGGALLYFCYAWGWARGR